MAEPPKETRPSPATARRVENPDLEERTAAKIHLLVARVETWRRGANSAASPCAPPSA